MEVDEKRSGVLLSSTEIRKRVRFSDTDLLATYYEETVSLLSHDDGSTNQVSSTTQKSWKVRERRSQASLETDFRGRYVAIQPADELVFEQRNEDGDKDSSDVIRLVNISPGFVAFKVKTTSPDKFRVRPCFGCIEPGASKTVEVSLQHASCELQKDRFLIISMPLEEEPSSLNDLMDCWQESLKDSATGGAGSLVDEHRLRCAIFSPSEISSVEKTTDARVFGTVLGKMDIVISKLDCLLALQKEIHSKRTKHQRNLLLLILIFVITVFINQIVCFIFGDNSANRET